jgi:hypothetical protein
MTLSQALYGFALWAEKPTPHAVLSFILFWVMAYLLLARDGGAV